MTLHDVIAAVFQRVLRTYQIEWMGQAESHSWLAILGGRQIGKDFTFAFYATGKALMEPGSEWHTFSASQKHAGAWLDDCRNAYKLIRNAAGAVGITIPALGADGRRDNVTGIRLHNGSTISSHASSVRSAVGLRGSVLLNEVAVLPNASDMYEALEPIVSGALDNGRAGKMIIISNASRRGTWWHRFWSGPLSSGWHKVTTTWEQAYTSMGKSRQWLDKRIARRVRRLGGGGYAQWYDCTWRSSEEGYLSLTLLERQTYRSEDWTPTRRMPQVIGYDVGRHVDPASFVRVIVDGLRRYALTSEARHKMPYAAQRQHLANIGMERRTLSAVIDSTGTGDSQAEECAAQMPFEVVPFTFTAQSKWALFSRLKQSLESGELWIPDDDLDLRMELEALTAVYRPGGSVGIDIPREGGGHGDRAVALALAEYGASSNDIGWWQAFAKGGGGRHGVFT